MAERPIASVLADDPAGHRAALGCGSAATASSGDFAPAGHNHDGVYAALGHGHGNATSGAAGFMSAADKGKLDGVEAGATANDTDANLKSRPNHTGTQAPATIAFSASDRLLGRSSSGAGSGEEVPCTAAGFALIAAADAEGERAALGLGSAAVRNMHVGTAPPSNPAAGDLWVDTN